MFVGILVLLGSWGSLTLGEWPMTPYLSFIINRPIIYFGLLLFAMGVVLWICDIELNSVTLNREISGMLWGKAAVIVIILAAIIGIILFALYADKPRLPEVDLKQLQFNHANKTYTVTQNISVWTSCTLRFKGTSVRYYTDITVKDTSGKEVYRDPPSGGRLSVTPAPSTPRNHIWEHAQTIRSKTFTLKDAGEYKVTITTRTGENYDTVKGALIVIR